MIKKRLALEEETFLSYSKRIASYLEEMPAFKNAKRIGFYMSYRHEVDTLHLIEKYMLDKEIYVPKCVGEELDFQRIYSMDDSGYKPVKIFSVVNAYNDKKLRGGV